MVGYSFLDAATARASDARLLPGNDKVSVAPIAGRGLSLVAAAPIAMGDVALAEETPLLRVACVAVLLTIQSELECCDAATIRALGQ